MTTNPTTDELQQHALRAYRGIELGLGEADPVAGVSAKLESQHPGAKTGRPKINILGQRFGRLLAVASVNGGWLCKCDCGVEKIISGGHLRTGRTISCGCYVQEHVKAPKTHGMRYSRVWRIWSGILQRCTNPRHIRYSDYGGRGIKVCDAWLRFNGFFADMGNPPAGTSIDRIDHNGDYTPQNCRWATPKTQARNTRTNRYLEINGECRALSDWCEALNLNYTTVHSRLRRGWSIEAALGIATHPNPRRRP